MIKKEVLTTLNWGQLEAFNLFSLSYLPSAGQKEKLKLKSKPLR